MAVQANFDCRRNALADLADTLRRVGEVALCREPRLDAHDEHLLGAVALVQIVQRRSRADRYPTPHSRIVDAIDHPTWIPGRLEMEDVEIAARAGHTIEESLRILDHCVDLEWKLRVRSQRTDGIGAEPEAGDKVTVHDVEVVRVDAG